MVPYDYNNFLTKIRSQIISMEDLFINKGWKQSVVGIGNEFVALLSVHLSLIYSPRGASPL
jgi:hypothetical protein